MWVGPLAINIPFHGVILECEVCSLVDERLTALEVATRGREMETGSEVRGASHVDWAAIADGGEVV